MHVLSFWLRCTGILAKTLSMILFDCFVIYLFCLWTDRFKSRNAVFQLWPIALKFHGCKRSWGNGEYHPHRRYNANLEDVVKMTTDIKLFDFGIGRDVRRCESVARLVKTIKLVKFPCFDIRFVLSDGLGCIFWFIFGNEIFNVIRIEDDYIGFVE